MCGSEGGGTLTVFIEISGLPTIINEYRSLQFNSWKNFRISMHLISVLFYKHTHLLHMYVYKYIHV